jgi:hypothetical protein
MATTKDKQTVENQVRELTAIAQRRGWEVVAARSDYVGVSSCAKSTVA